MNEKNRTIILIILFLFLLTGSYFLYSFLGKNYQPDTLMIENNKDLATENRNYTSSDSYNKDDTDSSYNTKNEQNTVSDTVKNNPGSSNNHSSENNSSGSNVDEETKEVKTQTAPDFKVYDINGTSVNLSDFFGKPVIVNFWASWCGPCQMEMPDFQKAYEKYQDDITFLMVNMTDGSRETIETASSFISEKGYTFPVYYDADYNASIAYSVTSLPTTYFINNQGELIAHAKGAIDHDTLQKGISMILNP